MTKIELTPYIKELCKKYKNGLLDGYSINNMGKKILPNKHIDFFTFAQYLTNQTGKTDQTIRQYLYAIHKWQVEFNEANLKNFEDVSELMYNKKEQTLSNTKHYVKKKAREKRENTQQKRMKIENRKKRFKNFLRISLLHYCNAIKRKDLKKYLDADRFSGKLNPKKRRKPNKNFMTEEMFIKFIKNIKNIKFIILYHTFFYTGCRVSEILQMRKNKKWFPELKKYKLPHREVMLIITIPPGYAKTDSDGNPQKLYIANLEVRRKFVDYVNTIKPNHFVFDFLSKGGSKIDKTYDEICKEMRIIRENMEKNMLDSNFNKDFIEKFTIHSWRFSNIKYTQKITENLPETQMRARHSSAEMTNYYLQSTEKDFEKSLFEKTQKKKN